MTINIIAAVAKNNAIGFGNKLLYRLPDDLKRFKALTSGHTVIMGRKTFESLPKGALPNRRNVVLSRTQNNFPGCDTYATLEEALKSCGEEEEVFVIGGAHVYEQTIHLADKLYLTEIEDTPGQADAFFPSYANWKPERKEEHEKNEKHEYRYTFADYVRPMRNET